MILNIEVQIEFVHAHDDIWAEIAIMAIGVNLPIL